MIGRLVDSVRRTLSLPLLARELTEASARRRTYLVRAVYAGLLFTLAIIFAWDVLFPVGDRFFVLGRGDELFLTVVLIQFAGIYLFLPAMTCAAITSEKERNTLGLLFLTRLTPSKILIEKLLGRIFPMFSLLLLSLPLFGIAYTLGGMETRLIWEAVVRLVATTLMVGAIGIAASAWCRTTAGSFFVTYAALIALFPGCALLLEIVRETLGLGRDILAILNAPFEALRLTVMPDAEGFLFIFFGPISQIYQLDRLNSPGAGPGAAAFLARGPLLAVWQATPVLFAALCAFAAARVGIVRRAEAKPKRIFIRAFRYIDATFREFNDRYAKGIEIIPTRDEVLGNDPVAWRECTKTVLGAFRYLVRIGLLVEIPVVVVGVLATDSQWDTTVSGLRVFTSFIWLAACFLIAVKGAVLFPMERSRQSLGVLLTTNLATREILRQKMAGLWRLMGTFAVPLLTLFWVIAYMATGVHNQPWPELIVGFLGMVLVVATTFPMVGYMAVLIGLRTQRVSRAVLSSVSVFVAVCLVGPILYLVIEREGPDEALVTGTPFSLYSPLSTLGEAMLVPLELDKSIILIGGTLLLYGGLAFVLRGACYRNAAQWLGRGDELAPPRFSQKQLAHYQRHRPQEVTG